MSYSGRQPTGAGHDEAASRNYLSRKKSNTPIYHPPSPDFQSLLSTATPTSAAAVCEISPSQLDRITHRYRNSFIAWIFGKDISPRQLVTRLYRHLRLTASVEVSKLNRGNFVLNFSEKDYLALLRVDHPWSIPNLCIRAVPWIPNFKPSETVVYVVDAWIRLHELPIEYYDDEILRQIAEFIGLDLVVIDPVTEDRTKCTFARICVRLNLCNPLLSMIRIDGNRQEIEYEGFDLLCPRCRRVLDYCLCHPSGSSRFVPYNCRARTFQETGSTSKPNQPLISSETSVAWGSRYQILGEEPQALFVDLNDSPSLSVGGSKTAATRAGLVAEPIENQNKICEAATTPIEVPVELEQKNLIPSIALHDHPMSISSYPEAASTTITAPEIEQNNLTPSIDLNDHPMSISSYPDAAATTTTTLEFEPNNLIPSIAFHDHPMSISSYPEATSTTIEVPVELDQTNLIPSITSNDHPVSIASTTTTVVELEQNNLIPSRDLDDHPTPSHPEAAASTSIAAPAELEPNNSNLFMALAPSVVEDKFRATETCSSTTLAVHNNQLQLSAPTASIPNPQPIPTSETALLFYSNVIERSLVEKEITNTPFEGNGISHRPILYTIDPSIPSFAVGLSEGPNSIPKQNQFVINIMSSSRSGNKKMLGWKVRGSNANLIKGLKSVVQKYEPSIIVIFASLISDDDDVDEVREELDFYGTYCKMSDYCNRGVWLLMFKHDVETEVFEAPLQDSASAYADTETSWQTWGPASFCDSTYSMGNTLAY